MSGAAHETGRTDEAEIVRQDIERTRHELAATVDALSDKVNVKKRAGDKVEEARSAVSSHPRETAIAGAAVLALTALVVVIRRRRSR